MLKWEFTLRYISLPFLCEFANSTKNNYNKHMFWVCFGCVLGVFWVCFGCVLGVFWVCFGCVSGVFRVCFGCVLGVFQVSACD